MSKVRKIIIKNIKWIIALLALMAFIGIVEELLEKEIYVFDNYIYNNIISNMISNNLTSILKIITNFGGVICLSIVTILLAIFLKDKKEKVGILLNLIMISGTNILAKAIIARQRPVGNMIIKETGYSFPSGHSMISMAVYGYLIYLVFNKIKNKLLKYSICTLLGLLILFIGISRIYLGVHYTSDVIAGFIISISYLILFTSFLELIFNVKNNK